jgi:hypothetical protein
VAGTPLGGAVVLFLIRLPLLSGGGASVAAQDGIRAPSMHLDAERGQTGNTLTFCKPRRADPADRVSFHLGSPNPATPFGCNPSAREAFVIASRDMKQSQRHTTELA